MLAAPTERLLPAETPWTRAKDSVTERYVGIEAGRPESFVTEHLGQSLVARKRGKTCAPRTTCAPVCRNAPRWLELDKIVYSRMRDRDETVADSLKQLPDSRLVANSGGVVGTY
jgi:hypothetical protein